MSNIHTKEYQSMLLKLIEARNETGMTQKDVASILNKHQSYVSKSESGERRIDVIELKRFADLYAKPLEFFVKP